MPRITPEEFRRLKSRIADAENNYQRLLGSEETILRELDMTPKAARKQLQLIKNEIAEQTEQLDKELEDFERRWKDYRETVS